MAKNIQIALQSGRDGKAGVDLPEAMLLEEQLLRGEDITQLRQNLTFLIARHKKELERKERENIMLQNQGLMQLEQVKAQNMQMETQSKAAIAQASEIEKRKTERLVQNYQFLNKLMETVQKEEQSGGVSPQNANRLQLAMTVAGQLNLAEADLPSEVARIERSRPQVPMAGMPTMAPPQQSPTPQFPPMSAPTEMPL
jgi:CO dehydrogenase/acetyl-CoA synthase alpha subunit